MKRLPAKVVERAKAVAAVKPQPPPKPQLARTVAPAKKAKLVAALKRLHPMD